MTTRSTRSNRSSKEVLTDGDVYVFLLQTALLQHLAKPKPAEPKLARTESHASPSPSPAGASGSGNAAAKPASSSSNTANSQWGFAAIAEMLVGASKEARFPEKLIKRLNERLEKIAMGKDPTYRDQSFRSTIGIFYGQYQGASFQKQMRDNRKVEDLILHFATTAQASLRKRATGDEWKEELELQVGSFVKVIREALKTVSGVPPALTERLEAYSTKLAPKPISLSAASSSNGSSRAPIPARSSSSQQMPLGSAAAGTSEQGRRESAASLVASDAVTESALVRTVGRLFRVQEAQLRADVESLRKTCTDKAAVADLKRCTANVNLDGPWPGQREDFCSDEAWQTWKSRELSTLSQMIMRLCQNNPELLKTTTSSSTGQADSANGASASRRSSAPALDADDVQSVDGDEAFTYIPPDPRRTYQRALELCLDFDLEEIRNQEDAEEVSLSILSPPHVELLKECAQWWRISLPFRALANLDYIRIKFEGGEAPLDCISVALGSVDKVLAEAQVDHWMVPDRQMLARTYTQAFEAVMRGLYEAFQDVRAADAEEVASFASIAQELHHTGFVRTDRSFDGDAIDIEAQAEDIKDSIRIHAIHEYTEKTTELFSQVVTNEIVPLVQLIDWLERNAKHLDRSYPQPLLGIIDPVALVLEKQVPLFYDDLDSMRRQILDHALREHDALAFDDIFLLYHRVMALRRMFKAFCPQIKPSFAIHTWFEPHVQHWLMTTDKKTSEWVHSAIRSDRFLPIDSADAYHSSSIDDLFGALQQPLDFIQSLKWPSELQQAQFLTSLSKTFSQAIEQYCNSVEERFMEEMFPRSAEGQDQQQKQSAWMVKAKQTLQGEKKVEPFHFQPESCVKLNNIEAARILLDKLYARVDADQQARIIEQHSGDPEVQRAAQRTRRRYIFTVKIVLGEGLRPINTSGSTRIDSFVTLSDERGSRIAKTRTIYETPDPRWDEVFDIPVEQSIWVAATVWDRKLVGDHALCGRAYLRLDPRYFGDLHAHELWLDLDTQGKLLLRVSMEGERDDILFHFGRAFRSLKRAEGDMVRIIVDKMSIFIRHCLSRQVLRSLVRTSGIQLDKALVNLKALYNTALASTNATASMIPPVESEATRNRSKGQQLTDAEIEAAITPLLDYFDECLATLKSSLSEKQALVVLTKVWKEVLNIIESILLPPLSDAPTDMQQLSEKEVDIVFKWLTFLRNYFNAYDEETGTAGGVPLEQLQNNKYREILQYLLWQDATTDALMEECARSMQQSLRKQAGGQLAKSKSVYNQRSLGTIKKRKQEKKEEDAPSNEILVMKLLRMRPGTQDFLASQMRLKAQLSALTGAQSHKELRNNVDRGNARGYAHPPLPPLK